MNNQWHNPGKGAVPSLISIEAIETGAIGLFSTTVEKLTSSIYIKTTVSEIQYHSNAKHPYPHTQRRKHIKYQRGVKQTKVNTI